MERDQHIAIAPDARDRRSRVVMMTESGRHVWQVLAKPKILENMQGLDAEWTGADAGDTGLEE